MVKMETVFERWVECGLTPDHVRHIPDKLGRRFIKGNGVLLTAPTGCPSKVCGGNGQAVILLELNTVPQWLRSLLDQSLPDGENKK